MRHPVSGPAVVDQTVVIWPVFLLNQDEMLLPKTVTTAISAIATRAMSRPYSVTAMPSSERRNFFKGGSSCGRLERNNSTLELVFRNTKLGEPTMTPSALRRAAVVQDV